MVAEREEDDDWAPLTPEQLLLQPGETGAPLPTPEGAPPTEGAPAPDPFAEQLLQEFQERLASAPKSQSLVASVQERERRLRRQEQAKQRSESALAATVVQGEEPASVPPPPPELAIDEKRSDCDPRELEPWFGALPDAEQQRLRQTWKQARDRQDQWSKNAKKRLVRAACYGALAFLANGILLILAFGSLRHIPGMVVMGAICGPIAQLIGGMRFHYMAIGALGFAVLHGANMLSCPTLLYGLLFAIATMGIVGMDGEMRRSAGCRDD